MRSSDRSLKATLRCGYELTLQAVAACGRVGGGEEGTTASSPYGTRGPVRQLQPLRRPANRRDNAAVRNERVRPRAGLQPPLAPEKNVLAARSAQAFAHETAVVCRPAEKLVLAHEPPAVKGLHDTNGQARVCACTWRGRAAGYRSTGYCPSQATAGIGASI